MECHFKVAELKMHLIAGACGNKMQRERERGKKERERWNRDPSPCCKKMKLRPSETFCFLNKRYNRKEKLWIWNNIDIIQSTEYILNCTDPINSKPNIKTILEQDRRRVQSLSLSTSSPEFRPVRSLWVFINPL